MIICLETSILGGHLSNEVPGLITGSLHLAGSRQPVQVELAGNFCRDIAGCRVDLHNPLPDADLDDVAWVSPLQSGFSGVMTASYRVVKMPRRRSAGGKKLEAPAGLKNLLFMEWFNKQGQRLLIQSWQIQVRVGAPCWKMSAEEESAMLRQARTRRKHFLLNQREDGGSQDALLAPGLADPFEPHDLRGNPFDTLPENLPTREKESKSGGIDPAARAATLHEELRRFGNLLDPVVTPSVRPAMIQLLSTVADLAVHLMHALRHFKPGHPVHGRHLVVDLEQSLPLFGAALNSVDKLASTPSMEAQRQWLARVQAGLLGIELRMRELLSLIR
ncbi:MAG TPA: hypothetical protein DIT64_13725 [Verrucomicrobiales bacterium]|nr:hypothetical protein [Verrucomicrobiales bacterium]HCN78121.1 hypothetical protein [Verrucomicrobiales bacterium]HRJ08019.1 hypothetical protein [Prosthecobacter sp.]HRK12656.1 hypothetical protein [Prosthecobacter sp.]